MKASRVEIRTQFMSMALVIFLLTYGGFGWVALCNRDAVIHLGLAFKFRAWAGFRIKNRILSSD